MKIEYKKSSNRKAGFSLVEVSIAMAIAAVALVTLIGLIPEGLKTLREAGDQAIEARIHQQILSEMQLTPFRNKQNNSDPDTSPLKAFHNQLRIYDQQGVELGYAEVGQSSVRKSSNAISDESIEFNWAYSARIWLPIHESGRTPASMGGATISEEVVRGQDSELRTVIIEVVPFPFPVDGNSNPSLADRLGEATSFFTTPRNFQNIDTFQTTIVRMGADYTPN